MIEARRLSILAWWGGFFGGPMPAIAVLVAADDGCLAHSHGRAATIWWSLQAAVYGPLAIWAVVDEHPAVLVVAATVGALLSVGACLLGTMRARRNQLIGGASPSR